MNPTLKEDLEKMGFVVTQAAPGMWSVEKHDYVTYQKDQPAMHLHYAYPDDVAEAQGWSQAEFCCHGCGQAQSVRYPFPFTGETDEKGTSILLKDLKDRFKADHKGHAMIGGNVFCPPFRSAIWLVDLREVHE